MLEKCSIYNNNHKIIIIIINFNNLLIESINLHEICRNNCIRKKLK